MVSLKKSTPITFQVYPITPKKTSNPPPITFQVYPITPKKHPIHPQKTPPIPWGKNTHGKDKNFYPYLHHRSYYIFVKEPLTPPARNILSPGVAVFRASHPPAPSAFVFGCCVFRALPLSSRGALLSSGGERSELFPQPPERSES